ncbi:MAG: hypothetical protein QOK15_1506 [Nocardioidaceae bacterium]|nr:hypothetical protein [Nocardioidaceae bacterium]
MAYQGLEDDRLERLDLGTGTRRGTPSPRWRAVGLLALGAVLGWAAHATTGHQAAEARQDTGRSLVVGSFQQNLVDPYGPELVVSVANTGGTPVNIDNVAPAGWHTRTDPVQVLPGDTVDIPVDVFTSCATLPDGGQRAEVRIGTGSSARTLLLPMGGSPALQELWLRRCRVESLRAPTRRDLLGTWLVNDGGPAFTGRMFIALLPGGRYEMDAGAHLDDSPGAVGLWSLHDGRVTLVSTRGGDCGPRHRAAWEVGMRGTLLHIRQLTAYDGFCTVDRGDVWIAERIVR